MAYSFEKVKILIVEDNQPMAELLRSLLETFGFQNIMIARNGEEGFEAYCREKPDLVIADWMMKPLDGIALTRRLRTDPKSPNPFVPVILMTGFSEKHRVTEARDAGITEFLVKPFNARDLYRRIAQIIENPRLFVRAEGFFGPDRRRKNEEAYQGPNRREDSP
jgi:CheY-like chemotaxis protein